MDILQKIAAFKFREVEERKKEFPVIELQRSEFFNRNPPSFYDALSKNEPSVIAEFKRKSPSKGIINSNSDVKEITINYCNAGVAAISILTDNEFFGGNNTDLIAAASVSVVPILRKEFIINEYQLIESKSLGASAILLIGSILSMKEIKTFTQLAFNLGLEVLYEIHNLDDLEKLDDMIRIIGVNNRNLRTFDISLKNSSDLLPHLPRHCLKVAESGIKSANNVMDMFYAGFDAFLIGENFMSSDDPGKCAASFVNSLKKNVR